MDVKNNLIYIVPGILIILFVVYFTVSYKGSQGNEKGNKIIKEKDEEEPLSTELLTSGTWWNDEYQLAIDFFEDGTGLYVEALNEQESINYQLYAGAILVVKNSEGKLIFEAKINQLQNDSLVLKNAKWGSLGLTH